VRMIVSDMAHHTISIDSLTCSTQCSVPTRSFGELGMCLREKLIYVLTAAVTRYFAV